MSKQMLAALMALGALAAPPPALAEPAPVLLAQATPAPMPTPAIAASIVPAAAIDAERNSTHPTTTARNVTAQLASRAYGSRASPTAPRQR